MSIKEATLVVAAILFLALAIHVLMRIDKLKVSKSYKMWLRYITIILPIFGFWLVWRTERK